MRLSNVLSRLMTKQYLASKLKALWFVPVVFFLGYILQVNFVLPLFFLSIFAYLKATRQDKHLLELALLFVISFVTSYVIIGKGLGNFYLPVAVIPMLAVLLFESMELALLLSLLCAVSLALLSGSHYAGILFLTSGIASAALSRKARLRSTIIRTGFIVGLLQGLSAFFINAAGLKPPDASAYLMYITNGIACGIIVIGVLPVFEYLFKTVTNISLLEMADFNQPLLQRLITQAPGTYHHSLVVGNLSEAACQAIGANALLARIGAYYHDIGKLQKPEYFSENQGGPKETKHEALAPTMSKLVIMNHVNEGLDLAKKYKLKPRITDFVRQHHGTSLVYYFYRRALESLEEDQSVVEEGFRYPGPKPNTKETAVVLLADSVEAATRALKEPSSTNVSDLVHKIINNKFIDGQLDECELTLKDLERISSVFIRILSGIYHSRLAYPENTLAQSEDNHKKPAKENSHQTQNDKKSGP